MCNVKFNIKEYPSDIYTLKADLLIGTAFDLILGTNYLREANLCLDFATGSIKFDTLLVKKKEEDFLSDNI